MDERCKVFIDHFSMLAQSSFVALYLIVRIHRAIEHRIRGTVCNQAKAKTVGILKLSQCLVGRRDKVIDDPFQILVQYRGDLLMLFLGDGAVRCCIHYFFCGKGYFHVFARIITGCCPAHVSSGLRHVIEQFLHQIGR